MTQEEFRGLLQTVADGWNTGEARMAAEGRKGHAKSGGIQRTKRTRRSYPRVRCVASVAGPRYAFHRRRLLSARR